MSIEMVNYVWNHSKHSGSALLTLLAIADYAGDDGRAWPTMETIRKKTKLSERQTVRIIKKLEDSGELEVEHRRNIGNIYTVITDIMSVSNPITDMDDIIDTDKKSVIDDTMTHITDSIKSVDPLTSNKLTKLPTTNKEKEIEEFLKRVPVNYVALADAFCHMHGRPPTQGEEKYWRKCWIEQVQIGLTPGPIMQAYQYMDQHDLTVRSPQSLNAVAERIKRKEINGSLAVETDGTFVELGDVRYPTPKSKRTV